jgi:hypothetical protein
LAVFDRERSSMLVGDPPGDGQAQAGARGGTRRLQPDESIEDPRAVRRAKSCAEPTARATAARLSIGRSAARASSQPAGEQGDQHTRHADAGQRGLQTVQAVLNGLFPEFADPETPYMYHCHILQHEDQGMMGQFVVVSG